MKLDYDVYDSLENSNLAPIVLHHGLFETKNTWKLLAQALAQKTGRKVYAIDARNHGNSPWSDEFNYDILISDLRQFLDDANLQRVILIGHSLGGKVAIGFTLKYPEKIEMLIVEDVSARKFKSHVSNLVLFAGQSLEAVIDIFKEVTDQTEADKYLRDLGRTFAEQFVISPEKIDDYLFDLLPLRWNGKYYDVELNLRAIVDAIIQDKLQGEDDMSGKYEGNALFLFGSQSQFKSYKDSTIETYFPNSKRVMFQDAGHFIHHTHPKQFLNEVVQFITINTAIKSKY